MKKSYRGWMKNKIQILDFDTNSIVWTILISLMVLFFIAIIYIYSLIFDFFNIYLEINSFISFLLMFISFPLSIAIIVLPIGFVMDIMNKEDK